MRSASWVFASSVLTLLILAGLIVAGAAPASAQTPSTNADLDSITVDGTAVPGFASSRTSYQYGVLPTTASIVATPSDSGASVAYSGTDRDSSTAGLQLTLSNGRNAVTITVTAADGTTIRRCRCLWQRCRCGRRAPLSSR